MDQTVFGGGQLSQWLMAGMLTCATPVLAQNSQPPAPLETPRFAIQRFQVDGSKILSEQDIQNLVAPYVGPQREYGDIQRALESIELAYRKRGYSAVHVLAPEQELTDGVVRLLVNETILGKVKHPAGLHHIDTTNLRAGLPALREGETPNALDLSAQIALNNENPAKQIEVILNLGENSNEVDANIKVSESNPVKTTITLDNSGNQQTGRHRIGVAMQHANLWNRDHVATLAYQTSPGHHEQVHITSLSYRLPVYEWAGAFDFIFAYSSVDSGSSTITSVGGPLSFTGGGKGRIYGLRYTQALPRQADTTQKIVFGWDIKSNNNSCDLTLQGSNLSTPCGGASSTDITLRPLSLTYQRMTVSPGQVTELNGSLVVNLPGGKNGHGNEFQASRPEDGGKGTSEHYGLLRFGFTHFSALEDDWQFRFAANAQWTPQALLAQEKLGLAGNNAVRGFLERELATDIGAVVNTELYSPNLANAANLSGSLRALAFLDAGTGHNRLLRGERQVDHNSLASWGFGLRYSSNKDIHAKLDLAKVITPNGEQSRGDWRGHFSLALAF